MKHKNFDLLAKSETAYRLWQNKLNGFLENGMNERSAEFIDRDAENFVVTIRKVLYLEFTVFEGCD